LSESRSPQRETSARREQTVAMLRAVPLRRHRYNISTRVEWRASVAGVNYSVNDVKRRYDVSVRRVVNNTNRFGTRVNVIRQATNAGTIHDITLLTQAIRVALSEHVCIISAR